MAYNVEHMSDTVQQQNLAASIRVTLIGAVLDLVLGILKIIIGISANSIALISDGVHPCPTWSPTALC